jgi:hypothetical protein
LVAFVTIKPWNLFVSWLEQHLIILRQTFLA